MDRDTVSLKAIHKFRGVETPCGSCRGLGWRVYGQGSTWKGGMGTTSYAYDVCCDCWGSGDTERKGVDLRALRDEESKRVAEAAGKLLEQRVGAWLTTLRPALVELTSELDRLSRQTRPRPNGFQTVAAGLSTWIREILG